LDTAFNVPFNGNGWKHRTLPWEIPADQNTTIPEAGGAKNPVRPERSGIATVVDPFR
jgi:hypothetical protein